MAREFSVIIERDAEGYYVASVPALRGCHTQARSLGELMARVSEAVELCLEVQGEITELLDFVGVQKIAVTRPGFRESRDARSLLPCGEQGSRSSESRAVTTSSVTRMAEVRSCPYTQVKLSALASWRRFYVPLSSAGKISSRCYSGVCVGSFRGSTSHWSGRYARRSPQPLECCN